VLGFALSNEFWVAKSACMSKLSQNLKGKKSSNLTPPFPQSVFPTSANTGALAELRKDTETFFVSFKNDNPG
jgi:hypothetical protein